MSEKVTSNQAEEPTIDKKNAAKAKAFEPVQFAGTNIKLPDEVYRVYSSADEYKEINASSAYEAMQKSGIQTPFRIQRYSVGRLKVLTQQVMAKNMNANTVDENQTDTTSDTPEITPADATQQTAEEASPPPPPPTEEDAANRELRDDEVDALLNTQA